MIDDDAQPPLLIGARGGAGRAGGDRRRRAGQALHGAVARGDGGRGTLTRHLIYLFFYSPPPLWGALDS